MRSIIVELRTADAKAKPQSIYLRRDFQGFWNVIDANGNRIVVSDNMNQFAKVSTAPVRMIHILENWDDMANAAAKSNSNLVDVVRTALTPVLNAAFVVNNVII